MKREIIKIIIFIITIMGSTNIFAQNDRFTDFIWAGTQSSWGYLSKGAMLIPVKIQDCDQQFYVQFDTGTQGFYVFGDILKQFSPNLCDTIMNHDIFWYKNDTGFASTSFPLFWEDNFDVDNFDHNQDTIRIGHIGSDMLLDKKIMIDYPNQKFAVYNKEENIPLSLISGFKFTNAKVQYNQFFISVIIGKDTLETVLFDTGASEFTLLISKEKWSKYTGLKGDEEIVKKATLHSWGNYYNFYRAHSKYNLIFSKIEIEKPIIECSDHQFAGSDNFSLMGNAPFYNDYTIMIDFVNARFGLTKSVK